LTWLTDPVADHRPKRTRDVALVLRMVNDRANLLPADKVVEEAALDKYSYIRDAYLQRRRNLIHDGNPPRESRSQRSIATWRRWRCRMTPVSNRVPNMPRGARFSPNFAWPGPARPLQPVIDFGPALAGSGYSRKVT
jgi:hypothetical protein